MIKFSRIIFQIIIVTFVFFGTGCGPEDPTKGKHVLAKVFNNYFFLEDLSALPPETSPQDSIAIVKGKIDMWVRKQLMLNKAELNLSNEDKNIDRIVEDYRASLLIDKYKRAFLKEKLDTNVTELDIEHYYKNFAESFKTSRVLVKAVYVKVPVNAENIFQFRQWFSKNEPKDSALIKDYITRYAQIYKPMNKQWIPFSELAILLPVRITNVEPILKTNSFIQNQDAESYYFIRFDDYRLIGSVKPLELVEEEIKIVLINKRKVELLNSLENSIYQNAIESGNIDLFDFEEQN